VNVIGLGLYRVTSYCITDVGIFGSAVIVIAEITETDGLVQRCVSCDARYTINFSWLY
jgi:hypothetical protein